MCPHLRRTRNHGVARFDFVSPGKRTAMVGELMMLPVRVGVRATRLWFRAVEETVSVASSATERVIGVLGSRRPDDPVVTAPAPREPDPFSRPAPEPMRELRREPAPTAPPAVEPTHVSEEPVLVEEFAEPGAEDGAGAQVHVAPPWDAYERMNARAIVARLGGADAAELAAVELYELTTRRRQTILNAVERELRRVNGSGSRGNPIQRG
jgi:hypothetical protein